MRLLGLILIGSYFFLTSCEKEVHIDLKSEGEKLVVEGAIENGTPPFVKLSKSIGFFDKVDLETVLNSFVHGAEVYVSDDTRTIRLKEYEATLGGYSGYVYTVDTADPASLLFLGEVNKSYHLKIVYEGVVYESTTTIPSLNTGVDSMWSERPADPEIADEDTAFREVHFRYHDDPQPGQKIRYFVQVNDGIFLPPFYSVNNDDIINGTTVNLQLEKGFDKFADSVDFDFGNLFYAGDTVTLKWSAIDNATYDFYSTLEFTYGSVGNPFAGPIIVTSNISNNALGVWAGYASTYHTYVVE